MKVDASGTTPGLPARRHAISLIDGVLRQRRSLDEAIEAEAGLAALDARDRAFVRLLAATTLRRLGQIDAILSRFLERPLPPRAARVHAALRLGAMQLVYLEIAPHAAVATALELIGGREASYRGLVNAVLRRVAETTTSLRAEVHPTLNLPQWLLRSWRDAYGESAVEAIAEIAIADPPLDLTCKTDAGEWAARLGADLLPTGTLRLTGGGRPEALAGFTAGAWWVQDAAASLPVRLLGALDGRLAIDLCAAPGGKTAQLAAGGARVIAVERNRRRAERLRGNLARLDLAAEIVVADAAAWQPSERASAVLLDAACSATGTLRRNPDMPHLKTAQDVARLAALQDRLLENAAEITAPGGTLVYCVCSLEPEEGPQRVARFLARRPDFARRVVTAAEIGGLAQCIDGAGDLRTLPHHLAERGGLDGFYAARLDRRA